jgi:hypothetical protein
MIYDGGFVESNVKFIQRSAKVSRTLFIFHRNFCLKMIWNYNTPFFLHQG